MTRDIAIFAFGMGLGGVIALGYMAVREARQYADEIIRLGKLIEPGHEGEDYKPPL